MINLTKIIASSIVFFSVICSWAILMERKVNFKEFKFYLLWISLSIFSIFNYFFVNNFIRISLLMIVLTIVCKLLFNENIRKTIITCIYEQIILMIAEMIFALVITLLNIDINLTLNSYFIHMVSNIFISLILIFIIRFKFVKKTYQKILTFVDRVKSMQLYFFCILIMLFSNILSMSVYYRIKFQYLLIFNVIMTIVCWIIIFYSFKTQNKYNKVNDKYNIAINSLKDYENMMTKYRILNHENKNLLLTVRAMIINNESDIPKYIDSIIDNKYNDDEKLLFEMSVIPTGGLRAAIYSEILKIKSNKIKYSLNIDKRINTIDLIEMDKSTIIDICKIIGVFIDNAIYEVKKSRIKNIEISIFLEGDNLNIKVSNNCKEKIDIDKIYQDGYTTKGKNHGYGLSLVRNIILSNKLLDNKTEINRKLFSQILIIRYKKTVSK